MDTSMKPKPKPKDVGFAADSRTVGGRQTLMYQIRHHNNVLRRIGRTETSKSRAWADRAKYQAWANADVFSDLSQNRLDPIETGRERVSFRDTTFGGPRSHREIRKPKTRSKFDSPALLFTHDDSPMTARLSLSSNDEDFSSLEVPPSVMPPRRRFLRRAQDVPLETRDKYRSPMLYQATAKSEIKSPHCPLNAGYHAHTYDSRHAKEHHVDPKATLKRQTHEDAKNRESDHNLKTGQSIEVEYEDEEEIFKTIERESLKTIAQHKLFEPSQVRRFLTEVYCQNQHLNKDKLRMHLLLLAESLGVLNLSLHQ